MNNIATIKSNPNIDQYNTLKIKYETSLSELFHNFKAKTDWIHNGKDTNQNYFLSHQINSIFISDRHCQNKVKLQMLDIQTSLKTKNVHRKIRDYERIKQFINLCINDRLSSLDMTLNYHQRTILQKQRQALFKTHEMISQMDNERLKYSQEKKQELHQMRINLIRQKYQSMNDMKYNLILSRLQFGINVAMHDNFECKKIKIHDIQSNDILYKYLLKLLWRHTNDDFDIEMQRMIYYEKNESGDLKIKMDKVMNNLNDFVYYNKCHCIQDIISFLSNQYQPNSRITPSETVKNSIDFNLPPMHTILSSDTIKWLIYSGEGILEDPKNQNVSSINKMQILGNRIYICLEEREQLLKHEKYICYPNFPNSTFEINDCQSMDSIYSYLYNIYVKSKSNRNWTSMEIKNESSNEWTVTDIMSNHRIHIHDCIHQDFFSFNSIQRDFIKCFPDVLKVNRRRKGDGNGDRDRDRDGDELHFAAATVTQLYEWMELTKEQYDENNECINERNKFKVFFQLFVPTFCKDKQPMDNRCNPILGMRLQPLTCSSIKELLFCYHLKSSSHDDSIHKFKQWNIHYDDQLCHFDGHHGQFQQIKLYFDIFHCKTNGKYIHLHLLCDG